jgi:hypothetical protein
MRNLARFVAGNIDGLLACSGFVCVAYGLALWSVSAAWVVSGCLLMAVAIVPHLRKGKP